MEEEAEEAAAEAFLETEEAEAGEVAVALAVLEPETTKEGE